MEASLQKKLIELFNYSPEASWYLGSAEAIPNEGFEVVDTKLKFISVPYPLSSELTDFPSSFQEEAENKEITNT
jgi:hypothetical protein